MDTPGSASSGSILELGIIGLGMAGLGMARAALVQPGIKLRGAVLRSPEFREAFARDFDATAYPSVEALLADPAIDLVYIASPHQFHVEHALLAADRGKHVLLEKPMALTLDGCDQIIEAVRRNRIQLVVGPTHGFNPPIAEMRRIIDSGELGPLGMVSNWAYTPFLYRPRRPEELDTAQGGGIVYNQVPHQIDIVRLLGGGMVRSIRAALNRLDPARPTEGGCTAFFDFENGVSATSVYSGYDFFDSDEFVFWTGENGFPKEPGRNGAARRALRAITTSEAQARTEMGYRGVNTRPLPPHQPHSGVTVATCARGEMRMSRDGLLVYTERGVEERALRPTPPAPSQGDALTEIATAIRTGRPATHNELWGKASTEVMLAIFQSARERREIMLRHQVPA